VLTKNAINETCQECKEAIISIAPKHLCQRSKGLDYSNDQGAKANTSDGRCACSFETLPRRRLGHSLWRSHQKVVASVDTRDRDMDNVLYHLRRPVERKEAKHNQAMQGIQRERQVNGTIQLEYPVALAFLY